MKIKVLVSLCVLHIIPVLGSGGNRDSKKLFGGYRITPKFCRPTRTPAENLGGPNICMFNHECMERNGQVVGACMDGFLFGACCQLPAGSAGELIESDLHTVGNPNNDIYRPSYMTQPPLHTTVDITSSGVSQIAESLLHSRPISTIQENEMVQVGNSQEQFLTTGITHPMESETIVLHSKPEVASSSTQMPIADRRTTVRIDDTTEFTPVVHISISNAPSYYNTPTPGFQKPMFRPKPPQKPSDADKYVLVPTITHKVNPNKTQDYDSVVNIVSILNETTTHSSYYGTSKKPPSTSYVFSSTSTKRPGYTHTTTRKPPSTSYVYSSTPVPSRPGYSASTQSTKRKTQKPSTYTTSSQPIQVSSTYIQSSSTYNYPTTSTKRPTTSEYIYSSSSFRPGHSTVASTPDAFVTTSRPPSTSYLYSSSPTRRPTISSFVSGPTFSISNTPGQFSNIPSPAPTLIVLGPVETETSDQSTRRPVDYSTSAPVRKPVTQLTINNHITQNIYSTERPAPSPTVLITPKPSISTSYPIRRPIVTEYQTAPVELQTSSNDLINFPPVRNPNLNMSAALLDESDVTTPAFIEDQVLDQKVESFVNKIIEGLQEPFQDLRDVVYDKNKTQSTSKPTKKPAGTTKRPTSKTTTRKPNTSRPGSTLSTRRPTTTTKRTKPTKRQPTTTTESFIEENDETTPVADSGDYRKQCGIRPLYKTGRIVGGKGAKFGEFPWQVLVRESTWLGLFTKNKCGGVLVGSRYVMTAAHCQPGFLASLVAVFGEFDISGDLESKRPISRNVKRVIVHRQYDAATFENDLALLELEHPVQFDSHIVPICLPRDGEDFTGRMATVTGWGRLKYGGGVPSVLQEVQVPIMENQVCQEMFRTAGHSKVILDSFLCAGYANGQKDSCEGDSGGPLVLQRPDGRYQLAGTVSHGIKCAAPYLPGVYMRTTYYKPWITSITGLQ